MSHDFKSEMQIGRACDRCGHKKKPVERYGDGPFLCEKCRLKNYAEALLATPGAPDDAE